MGKEYIVGSIVDLNVARENYEELIERRVWEKMASECSRYYVKYKVQGCSFNWDGERDELITKCCFGKCPLLENNKDIGGKQDGDRKNKRGT